MLLLAACGDNAASICSEDGEIQAFVMSQEAVRRALRAPSTASFPRITDSGVRVLHTDECEFAVGAYVDSQNAFGAMIRSRYLVTMKYDRARETWSGSKPIMD